MGIQFWIIGSNCNSMRHIIMNRTSNLFLYFLVVLLPLSVHGEVPVTLPDDQQISLETDQPNRHVDNSDRTGSAVGGNIEQATLFVDRKMERGNSCNFTLRLRNTTSFRIRNVVPQFSAIIQNNVVFATISAEFFEIGPSSEQERTIRFRGISCGKILGLKVHGANNCRMGSLNRSTATSLECLRRIRISESTVVNVFKEK